MPGQAIRPITAIMVTLLPEPDSPTTPSTSPASQGHVEAVDRAERAAMGLEFDREVADFEQ